MTLLENCFALEEFKQALLTHPQFIPTLLALRRPNAGADANTSLLYCFTTTPQGMTLLKNYFALEEFKQALLTHPQFIPTLLALRCPNAGAEANTSALYWFAVQPKFGTLLEAWFKADNFKQALLTHPQFIPTLLALRCPNAGANANTSALYWFVVQPEVSTLLKEWFKADNFKQALLTHPQFIPTLLALRCQKAGANANTSALYGFAIQPKFSTLLKEWFNADNFKQALFTHPQFIPTLLALRCPNAGANANTSALYWFVVQPEVSTLLKEWFKADNFKQALLTHPQFIPTLLALIDKKSKYHGNESVLLALVNLLPLNQAFLLAIFDSSHFNQWVLEAENTNILINTLFSYQNNKTIASCAFSILLAKGRPGQEIVKYLMSMETIRDAFFTHFSILNDEARRTCLQLLRTDSGFLLIHALSINERIALLSTASLQMLFKHPQIQQLIRMNQIKSEWFLFIALNQEDPLTDIQYFLSQNTLSPLAINAAGDSFYALANSLPENHPFKLEVLTSIEQALIEQSKHSSKNNFWMHLDEISLLQEDKPLETTPGNLANLKLPEPPAILDPGKNIEGVDENVIKTMEQHIEWVLMQEGLLDYHQSFKNLSKNTSIRRAPYFPKVLALLQDLIPIMNECLSQKRVPTFLAWNLTECLTGVLDQLHQMHDVFKGVHPVKACSKAILIESLGKYSSLLGVPASMEVHLPQHDLNALLGIASPKTIPHKDPYKIEWSATQLNWVAQQASLQFIMIREKLQDEMIMPLLKMALEALLFDTKEQATIDLTGLLETQWELTPFHLPMDSFNSSRLFEKNVFDVYSFLAYLLNQTVNDIEAHIENNTILSLSRAEVEKNLYEKLITQFEKWIQDSHLTALPNPKIINSYCELLWQFLTTESITIDQYNLLAQMPLAIEGPALIQYCLQKNQDQYGLIQHERFFINLGTSNDSLFSLLLKNPLTTCWLYEFTIKLERINNHPLKCTFEVLPHHLNFSEKWLIGSCRLAFEDALENALIQPGTLFFWLYYFQQQPLHTKLFEAIMRFIFLKNDHLFTYDSLLPLFYAMQLSEETSDNDKILVRSFLENRMQEQLKSKNPAYFQTACFLQDNPEAMKIRTQTHTEQHSWFKFAQKSHPQEAAYLLNVIEIPEVPNNSANQTRPQNPANFFMPPKENRRRRRSDSDLDFNEDERPPIDQRLRRE